MSDEKIIIVRKRRSDDEGEHHGGVWKLAFADFMTAMMAFFLVMWLINSTSKETKAVIVQYFNPIKLVDATNAHKGLQEPSSSAQGKDPTAPRSNSPVSPDSTDLSERIFADPIKTLDEIAENEPAAGHVRDPFERPTVTVSKEKHTSPANREKENPDETHVPSRASEVSKTATRLQAEIEKIASRETHGPKIEIKTTDEGILVSLTDDAKFSMFDVGSVKPKPQLVRIVGEVGKSLANLKGELELRGYTDGRVYAGKNYDNWRLSSDRASVVNYMLIRGGLPPSRIGKISGFADRQLKNPKDPLSPVNRRIEILIRNIP